MLTERFGVNMHGFKDYLALAAHGPDALTKLLSTDKVITIRNSVIGEEGPQTVGEQVIGPQAVPERASCRANVIGTDRAGSPRQAR